MPIAIRPFEMSCAVAYQLAVIVGSRMPGFVTKWPSLIFSVCAAASAKRRVRVLPEDVRVVRPRVLEALPLGELHQLDHPRVRRIGQNGDAEGQSHGRGTILTRRNRRAQWSGSTCSSPSPRARCCPFQFGINAQLAHWLGSPIRAAFVSFLVGTIALLSSSAFVRKPLPSARAARRRPVVGLDRRPARRVLRHGLDRDGAEARRGDADRGDRLRPDARVGARRPVRLGRLQGAARDAGPRSSASLLVGVGIALVRAF